MRIVHTSDWHTGRRWKSVLRLDEMARVLEHLAAFVASEKVDLVLHTGDVFDTRTPPGEAEELVHRFFVRMREAGAHMVVIAGNHDDPRRLDALALLAKFANVHVLGKPRSQAAGGTLLLDGLRCGENARVAALPFAAPGAWVSALQLAGDEGQARSAYARMFQAAVANLCSGFDGGAVNLLMAHTHLEGAVFGESERRVHVGEDWAATAQALPASAAYVALGHIHKPQKVEGLLKAYYAGSPLQLDFGEVGQDKSFVLVETRPGQPAHVRHVPYEGGKPLRDVRATLAELEAQAGALRQAGWLRVTVPLAAPDPDVARKVRALLPDNALVVHAELPESAMPASAPRAAGASVTDSYRAFHLQERGAEPDAEVLAAFERYHAQAQQDGEEG